MKTKSIYLPGLIILLLFICQCTSLSNEINLFNFGNPQEFIDNDLNENVHALENTLSKGSLPEDKRHLITELKGKISEYKKLLDKKGDPMREIRFKSRDDDLPENEETQHLPDLRTLAYKQQTKQERQGTEDDDILANLSKEEQTNLQSNTALKMYPFNVLINTPDVLRTDRKKNVYVDSRLVLKALTDPPLKKDVGTRSIPMSECYKSWDYKLHGEDWNCMCQCGEFQSPIRIDKKKDKIKPFFANIFIDFKDTSLCGGAGNICKYPLMKNSGNSIEIEDDCGILVLPPHMNGYRCQKIVFHTPAEHEIDFRSYEMEIQIFFHLEDRRLIDTFTFDNLVLSIFVKGIDEFTAEDLSDGLIRDHPFLSQLEMEKIPKKIGEARLLSGFLNYHLLFDQAKQPNKLRMGKTKIRGVYEDNTKVQFLQKTENKLKKAVDDLVYDKNYPLKQFYVYHGSQTQPPCDETVTLVINTIPVFAPMKQIITLSKVILANGNRVGNNRKIQDTNKRQIFEFKAKNPLEESIGQLGLDDESGEISTKTENNDEDLDEITAKDQVEGNKEQKYIDTVLNLNHKQLNQLLKINQQLR